MEIIREPIEHATKIPAIILQDNLPLATAMKSKS